jgi:hypothetical protein
LPSSPSYCLPKVGAQTQRSRVCAAGGVGNSAAERCGSSIPSPAAKPGAGQHVRNNSSGAGASCSGAEGAASAQSHPPSEPRA